MRPQLRPHSQGVVVVVVERPFHHQKILKLALKLRIKAMWKKKKRENWRKRKEKLRYRVR